MALGNLPVFSTFAPKPRLFGPWGEGVRSPVGDCHHSHGPCSARDIFPRCVLAFVALAMLVAEFVLLEADAVQFQAHCFSTSAKDPATRLGGWPRQRLLCAFKTNFSTHNRRGTKDPFNHTLLGPGF